MIAKTKFFGAQAAVFGLLTGIISPLFTSKLHYSFRPFTLPIVGVVAILSVLFVIFPFFKLAEKLYLGKDWKKVFLRTGPTFLLLVTFLGFVAAEQLYLETDEILMLSFIGFSALTTFSITVFSYFKGYSELAEMNLHILLAGIFLLSAVPAGFAAEKAGIDDMFLEVENPGTWNPMNPKYRDAMSCVRSLTSMCKDSDSKMIDTPVSCFNERGELLEGIRNKLPPNIRLDGEKAVCEPQDTSRDTENSSEASTEKDAGPKEIERIIRRTPEYYTSNLAQTYGYQVVLANGTDSTYKKTRTESRGQTAEETTYDKGYNITRDFVQSHDFVVREGNFKGEQVYVVEGEYCLDPQILKYTKC